MDIIIGGNERKIESQTHKALLTKGLSCVQTHNVLVSWTECRTQTSIFSHVLKIFFNYLQADNYNKRAISSKKIYASTYKMSYKC